MRCFDFGFNIASTSPSLPITCFTNAFISRKTSCAKVSVQKLVLFSPTSSKPDFKCLGVIYGYGGYRKAPPIHIDRLWRAAFKI